MSLGITVGACGQLFQQQSHAFQTPRWRGCLGSPPRDVGTGSIVKAGAGWGVGGLRARGFSAAPTTAGQILPPRNQDPLWRGIFSCSGWVLEGKAMVRNLLSRPRPPLFFFHSSRCLLFGFVLSCLVFSCSWPDGLCGERCQMMKPVSKSWHFNFVSGFPSADPVPKLLFLLTVNFLPDETFQN